MFFHNFKYTFKILLKNKALIFWTIMWPIILGTMFFLAFSNISNSEKLQTINLGVVDNTDYKEDNILVSTLNELSDKESSSYLFDITYDNESNLDKLLTDKKISGYILKGDKTKVIVKENGINETIIKYVIDEIYEYQTLAETLITEKINTEIMNGNHPNTEQIYSSIMEEIMNDNVYVNELSNKNMDYMMVEFYTLLAMTALFGSMVTTTVVSNYLANINKKGARITLSPISRLKILLSGLLAGFIIQIITIGILLVYTGLILKIDYGNRIDLVILLSLIGSLAGNSMGLVVGSLTFKNENSRIGLLISIVLTGCFFSGMMGVQTKYIFDKNIPILNKINPANMITDGFYSLYYYETLDRFYFNLISLLIVSGILLLIAYFLMRRKKYDSI